ncbi:NADH dehydrogenase [Gluconobacter oxydans]|uniref:NADH-quinone oxidoreductase subunit NuoE n=1 Tax=Gluconobacter thailandicus TaxID=257438 RepID=UPI0002996A3C|nr:NADH-quinone oxidoreductase subunit NuoE [Gluconobacter thailandicus]AFW01440.1 NADH dehydrogenase (ubiquinone) 24 kDa subunit [Gluconobacter oxydans H24]ANQ42906.1 NADH dehydrogenase [Gluconobacter oxydans]
MSTADLPLPDDLRQEILNLAGSEHRPRAASVSALRLVQARFRWISDRHLAEVAQLLNMSTADLDGVATYFNLLFRKPVGQHVFMICDSVCCWIMGCKDLSDHLCKKLNIRPGESTPDGAITLLPIVCLGHCDRAPVMLFDETVHEDVDMATLDRLIAEAQETPR